MSDNQVKCPHCGEVNGDLWEYDFDGVEGCMEVHCTTCDKPFTLVKKCTIWYETIPEWPEED